MKSSIWLLVVLMPFASRAEKYFIPDKKTNWFEAQEICQSMGANLATIPNSTVNDVVVASFLNSSRYDRDVFWIGANGLAHKGTLKWISNNEIVTYIPWGWGEPNNAGGNERCVNILPNRNMDDAHVWRWNDDGCHKKWHFICEKKEKRIESVRFAFYRVGNQKKIKVKALPSSKANDVI